MTAEEYIKHYTSGQGGFESVSVDVALRAIEYAKQEAKQQMMKDAVESQLYQPNGLFFVETINKPLKHMKAGDKVKLIIIKED